MEISNLKMQATEISRFSYLLMELIIKWIRMGLEKV